MDRAARLQTSNGFFCSVNHLSGCGVYANHNATHSPSLARKNKTENDSGLRKNSEGNRDDEWTFCREQGADIALFLKKKKKNKNRKDQNKVDRNAQITSKDMFPKRAAKVIHGTEKPKIPLTFATESRKQSF